jgi:hypothetical protein
LEALRLKKAGDAIPLIPSSQPVPIRSVFRVPRPERSSSSDDEKSQSTNNLVPLTQVS